MGYEVGSKGQVVIDKRLRDALGVEPGALTAQRLAGDHLEIRFFPPEHDRSLRGLLARKTRRRVKVADWRAAKMRAWRAAGREREKDGRRGG